MKQENFFKQFFSEIKKKLFPVVLSDLVFTFLLLYFLVYAGNKLYEYLAVIQSYTPAISDLKSALENNSVSYTQFESLVNNIDALTNKFLLFTYFIIPVVLLFIFIIFKGISYKLLSIKSFKEIFDFKYFVKFLVLTLPLFFVMFFVFRKLLELIKSTFFIYYGIGVINIYQQILLFLISLFIIFYFFAIAYSLIDRNSLIETLNKTFFIGFKKFYLLMPIFLPMFALLILYFILMVHIFLIYILSSFAEIKLSVLIGLFLVILFISSYKIFFSLIIKRFEN